MNANEEKLEKLKQVIILLQDCYTDKNERVMDELLDKADLEIASLCEELNLDYKKEMEGYY